MNTLNTLIFLLRLLTAGLLPIAAMTLTTLTLQLAQTNQDKTSQPVQTCLKCSRDDPGGFGRFTYSIASESPRQQIKKKPSMPPVTDNWVTETHFICDRCARRNLWHEVLLQIVVVLLYPLYTSMVLVVLNRNTPISNFVLEAFLMVLSIAGTLAALNLYRALHTSGSPLAEIRDRAAIQVRRKQLDKRNSYYTHGGMQRRKQ